MIGLEIFNDYWGIVIGVLVSTIFFIIPITQKFFHNSATKKIINNNIIQLVGIYDRIYFDIDKFDNNQESDQRHAEEITLYFEKKYQKIEMIRVNIENQLAHIYILIPKFIKKDNYSSHVKKILDDLDIIIEKCYSPKLPPKYQLSVWRDQRNMIKSTTKNTIYLAQNELNIDTIQNS